MTQPIRNRPTVLLASRPWSAGRRTSARPMPTHVDAQVGLELVAGRVDPVLVAAVAVVGDDDLRRAAGGLVQRLGLGRVELAGRADGVLAVARRRPARRTSGPSCCEPLKIDLVISSRSIAIEMALRTSGLLKSFWNVGNARNWNDEAGLCWNRSPRSVGGGAQVLGRDRREHVEVVRQQVRVRGGRAAGRSGTRRRRPWAARPGTRRTARPRSWRRAARCPSS